MNNFLAGLAAAFVGFIIWMTVSVFYGITNWDSDTYPAMFWWIATPAFLVMVGGPVWFWFIGPLWSWLRRRRT